MAHARTHSHQRTMLWIMGDAVNVESVETIFDGLMLYDYGHSCLTLSLSFSLSSLFSVALNAHTSSHSHIHPAAHTHSMHFIAAIAVFILYNIMCVVNENNVCKSENRQ